MSHLNGISSGVRALLYAVLSCSVILFGLEAFFVSVAIFGWPFSILGKLVFLAVFLVLLGLFGLSFYRYGIVEGSIFAGLTFAFVLLAFPISKAVATIGILMVGFLAFASVLQVAWSLSRRKQLKIVRRRAQA